MKRTLSNLFVVTLFVIGLFTTIILYGATGTPSNLVVRTDANNYLLVAAVTQTNPVTQGVFSSRTLRTDSSGSLQVVLTGTVTPTYPMSIPASTCAAPSLGESGATTTGIAFTATPSILMCVSGTARETLTASLLTSTVPILLPVGVSIQLGGTTSSFPGFGRSGTNVEVVLADNSAYTGLRASSIGVGIAPPSAGIIQSLTGFISTIYTVTQGTITADAPQLNGTVTWNNAGVTFTGWKLNVTDTASNAASLLMDLQVASSSVFNVAKTGAVTSVSNGLFSGLVRAGSGNGFVLNGTDKIFGATNGRISITDSGGTVGVEINNGTAAPTVTSCGTGTVSANSRNSAGEITATGATACTVTFGAPAWTNAPFCTISGDNALITTPYISARSTTAFTVSGLTAGDKFSYVCLGGV